MNLLPQKEIKAIKNESIIRLFVVVFFLIAIIEIVAIMMIIPSYVLIRAEKITLSESVLQMKNSIVGKGSVDDELKTIGKDIKEFIANDNPNELKISELINQILSLRPNGITTTSISVVKDINGEVVQMGGVGSDREALIEFQRILNSHDFIKEAKYTEKFIMQKSNIKYNLIINLKLYE